MRTPEYRKTFGLYFSLITVIVLFIIMEITYQILFEETIMVISHIFYFPIILCSFFLPKRGVIISTFIAMIYLIFINYFIPGVSEIIPSTMQFYVYISISVTTSLISERIREEKKKFTSIFNYSEGGIGLFNLKTGELIDKNKKFETLMEEWTILGNLESIEAACTSKPEENFIETLKENSGARECEIGFTSEDGNEHSAIVTVSVIPDDFAVLTISEITEIKTYQKKIASLNRDLSDANQKANMYLDILIHDINNANTASLGYAELIRSIIPESDEVYYDKMMTSIKHSSNIISNVSRIREIHSRDFKPSPVHLDKIVESAITKFPDLDVESKVNDLEVIGGSLLTDIFSIILENSQIYGGKGVRVTIRTNEDNEYAYTIIEDDGPGIPESKMDSLFTRFQPGKDGRRGRGLGLSVCWYIINKFGGDISASERIVDDFKSGLKITIKLKKYIPIDD